MELLIILAVILLLFAIFGGIYLSPFLWLVVLIVVILAVFAWGGRSRL